MCLHSLRVSFKVDNVFKILFRLFVRNFQKPVDVSSEEEHPSTDMLIETTVATTVETPVVKISYN